jgi:hypothetical protein
MKRRMLSRLTATGAVLVTLVTGLGMGGEAAGATGISCPPHCIEVPQYVMQHELPPEVARVRVWLSDIAPRDLTVIVNTVDVTAVAWVDYIPLRERPVTIRAGERFVDIPLQAVADGRPEPTEYYLVVISSPSYGVITNDRTLVTLLDGRPRAG